MVKRFMVLLTTVVVVSLLSGLLACAPSEPAEEETPEVAEVVTIKITGHMPIGHSTTESCERMMALAQERSGGTLEFVYYPAGQLYKDMRALEAVQQGEIEMAQFFLSRSGGLIPVSLFENPWNENASVHVRRLLNVEEGGDLYYTAFKPAFKEQGIYLMIGPIYGQGQGTITTMPIYSMEEFQGVKMRVNGPVMGAMAEALGCKPVVMSSSDVYMAIQRGTVDGGCTGYSSMVTRKWYEVADYVQKRSIDGSEILNYLVNPDFWDNTLSEEQREVIKEAMRETVIWSFQRAIEDEQIFVKTMEDAGLELFDFPPEELEKMHDAEMKALEEMVKPEVGEAAWAEHVRTLEVGKTSTRDWREILETCEWWD